MSKGRLFDIGKMRHRIAIYGIDRRPDGSGGFTRNDIDGRGNPDGAGLIGRFWAYIKPVSAKERQWGEQFTELTTHVCWLRYNTLIKEGMTLRRLFSDRQIDYYIEGMYDPDNLQKFWVLNLREGGPR